jgi:phospholipid/cholesterol/gamma-HCH transport system substrate-binding protein
MERRVAFILVGLFSLILITGVMVFILWANQNKESGKALNPYAIYFNQAVNGLSLGSSVRYLGVEIGQVQGISLDSSTIPPQVKIIVGIDKAIPITMGDVATIKPSGITGVSFIDLRHDKKDTSSLVASADNVPVIRSELSDLDKLLNSGSSSADHLNNSLAKIERVLDDKNIEHLPTILDNLDRTTTTLASHSNDISLALTNFASASRSLNGFIGGLRTNDFDRNASLAVRDSRQAVDNFSELSKSLHDDPSQILYPSSQQGIEISP